MKVVEFVKIGAEMLKLLSRYDIRTDDYKYVKLFEDFDSLRNGGDKVSYIVTLLADKYKISEASVYRILRRFGRSVKS